jgi:hypothetical protein
MCTVLEPGCPSVPGQHIMKELKGNNQAMPLWTSRLMHQACKHTC